MSEIDPTDHALATIASILEHPEPALVVRETEIVRATEIVVVGEQASLEEQHAADEHDEHPVVEEQPLVPDHTDADGYSKVGPGPMVAISKRRRSIASRTVLFRRLHALATSGRVEKASAKFGRKPQALFCC